MHFYRIGLLTLLVFVLAFACVTQADDVTLSAESAKSGAESASVASANSNTNINDSHRPSGKFWESFEKLYYEKSVEALVNASKADIERRLLNSLYPAETVSYLKTFEDASQSHQSNGASSEGFPEGFIPAGTGMDEEAEHSDILGETRAKRYVEQQVDGQDSTWDIVKSIEDIATEESGHQEPRDNALKFVHDIGNIAADATVTATKLPDPVLASDVVPNAKATEVVAEFEVTGCPSIGPMGLCSPQGPPKGVNRTADALHLRASRIKPRTIPYPATFKRPPPHSRQIPDLPGVSMIVYGLHVTRSRGVPRFGHGTAMTHEHLWDLEQRHVVGGKQYTLPDSVFATNTPIASDSLEVIVHDSKRAYMDASFPTIQPGGGVGGIGASVKMSAINNMEAEDPNLPHRFIEVKTQYALYTIQMKPNMEKALSPDFTKYVDGLPAYYAKVEDKVTSNAYAQFFLRFGTHVVDRVVVGGEGSMYLVLHGAQRSEKDYKDIATAVSLQLGPSESPQTPLSSTVLTNLQRILKEDKGIASEVVCIGGNKNMCKHSTWRQWKQSIAANPQPIQITHVPIYDVLPKNHPRRESIQRAMEEYLRSSRRSVGNETAHAGFLQGELFEVGQLAQGAKIWCSSNHMRLVKNVEEGGSIQEVISQCVDIIGNGAASVDGSIPEFHRRLRLNRGTYPRVNAPGWRLADGVYSMTSINSPKIVNNFLVLELAKPMYVTQVAVAVPRSPNENANENRLLVATTDEALISSGKHEDQFAAADIFGKPLGRWEQGMKFEGVSQPKWNVFYPSGDETQCPTRVCPKKVRSVAIHFGDCPPVTAGSFGARGCGVAGVSVKAIASADAEDMRVFLAKRWKEYEASLTAPRSSLLQASVPPLTETSQKALENICREGADQAAACNLLRSNNHTPGLSYPAYVTSLKKMAESQVFAMLGDDEKSYFETPSAKHRLMGIMEDMDTGKGTMPATLSDQLAKAIAANANTLLVVEEATRSGVKGWCIDVLDPMLPCSIDVSMVDPTSGKELARVKGVTSIARQVLGYEKIYPTMKPGFDLSISVPKSALSDADGLVKVTVRGQALKDVVTRERYLFAEPRIGAVTRVTPNEVSGWAKCPGGETAKIVVKTFVPRRTAEAIPPPMSAEELAPKGPPPVSFVQQMILQENAKNRGQSYSRLGIALKEAEEQDRKQGLVRHKRFRRASKSRSRKKTTVCVFGPNDIINNKMVIECGYTIGEGVANLRDSTLQRLYGDDAESAKTAFRVKIALDKHTPHGEMGVYRVLTWARCGTKYHRLETNIPDQNVIDLRFPMGEVTELTTSKVVGWAVDPQQPDAQVDVEIWVDGKPHVAGRADRSNSAARKMFDTSAGRNGFSLPLNIHGGRAHEITVYARVAPDAEVRDNFMGEIGEWRMVYSRIHRVGASEGGAGGGVTVVNPVIARVGMGYDVMSEELRLPVVDWTFTQNKRVELAYGQSKGAPLPDQVDVVPNAGAFTTDTTTIVTSKKDWEKKTKASFNSQGSGGASIRVGNFGVSTSLSSSAAAAFFAKKSARLAIHEKTIALFDATITKPPQPAAELAKLFGKLQTPYNAQNAPLYKSIIKQYGTHYYRSVTMGGKMLYEFSFESDSATKGHVLEAYKKSIVNSVNLLGVSGRVGQIFGRRRRQATQTDIMNDMKLTFRTLGGNARHGSLTEAQMKWIPSIVDSPVAVGTKLLEPISSLIQDAAKRSAFEMAIEDWIGANEETGSQCPKYGRIKEGMQVLRVSSMEGPDISKYNVIRPQASRRAGIGRNTFNGFEFSSRDMDQTIILDLGVMRNVLSIEIEHDELGTRNEIWEFVVVEYRDETTNDWLEWGRDEQVSGTVTAFPRHRSEAMSAIRIRFGQHARSGEGSRIQDIRVFECN